MCVTSVKYDPDFKDSVQKQKVKYFMNSLYVYLDVMHLFLGRGEGRKKERERSIDWLPLARPQLGSWPQTQACAVTRNQLVQRMTPDPLSHTSQGE